MSRRWEWITHTVELADLARRLRLEEQANRAHIADMHRMETTAAGLRADVLREKRVTEHLRRALDIRDAEVVDLPAAMAVKVAHHAEYAERLEAEVCHYRSLALDFATQLIEQGVTVTVPEFGQEQCHPVSQGAHQ